MTLTATWDGLEEYAARVEDAAARVADFTEVDAAAAATVLAAVDPPVRTGYLASTVVALPAEGGGVLITATARYAPYVHARNPFLHRAADAKADAVATAYLDHVTRALST